MILTLLCLSLCIGLVFWIRRAYLDLPLDRDFGQYLYLGEQWLKEGKLPNYYANALMAPGRMFACALAARVCGRDSRKIQLFFTCWNSLTAAAFFALSVHLFGLAGGTAACAFFVIFSNCRSVMSHYANAESLLNGPAILSILCISLSPAAGTFESLIPAGIFAGFAVIAKQPALVNLVFPVTTFLLIRAGGLPWDAFLFLGAAGLPVGVLYLYVLAKGVGAQNFFLSFTNLRHSMRFVSHDGSYHKKYIGEKENRVLRQRRLEIFVDLLPLLVIGAGGMLAWAKAPELFPGLLIVWWGGAAVLGLILSREYFGYHFITLIPPFSLAMVYAFTDAMRQDGPWNWVVPSFLLLMGLTVYKNLFYYFREGFAGLMKGEKEYFRNFEKLGRWLKDRVPPDKEIYVWTGEPTVYYFAERKSACRFTYFIYPNLLFKERFLVPACIKEYHSVLEDLEKNPPLYLAVVWPVLDYYEFVSFASRFYQLEEKFNNQLPVLRLKESHTKAEKRTDFTLDGSGKPLFTILLSVKEGYPIVKGTLASIYKNTLAPFELVFLVKKGSNQTLDYLNSFYKTRTIVYERDEELPTVCARAAEQARGKWICYLTEGTLLEEGGLKKLAAHFSDSSQHAAVSPAFYSGPGSPKTGKPFSEKKSSLSILDSAGSRRGRKRLADHHSSDCFLFSRAQAATLAPLWENLLRPSLQYHEVLLKEGLTMAMAEDVSAVWDPKVPRRSWQRQEEDLFIDIQRANSLAENGHWKEALLAFSQLLEWHPENPDCINGLGAAAWQLGQCAEAFALFLEGVKRAPEHPDLLSNLTEAGIAMDFPREAEELLRKIAKDHSRSPGPSFSFGKWLAAKGEWDKASSFFEKAEQDPLFRKKIKEVSDAYHGCR